MWRSPLVQEKYQEEKACDRRHPYNNNNNNNNKLKKKYLRRLRLVLSTELSAKNKIEEIGSLAVPVLRYSFGIVNWH